MKDRVKLVLQKSIKDTLRKKAEFKINRARPIIEKQIDELTEFAREKMKQGRQPFIDRNFPFLKSSTILKRDQMSRYNAMAEWASPPFSNVSFSGQFIKSFGRRIIYASKQIRVYWFFSGKRKKYLKENGRQQKGKAISNVDLAGFLIEKKHLTMRPSENWKEKIKNIIVKAFNKNI